MKFTTLAFPIMLAGSTFSATIVAAEEPIKPIKPVQDINLAGRAGQEALFRPVASWRQGCSDG